MKSKKKRIVPILILPLLCLVIGAWYFVQQKQVQVQTDVDQVSVEGVTPPEKNQSFSGMGTLAELRLREKDIECQVVYELDKNAPIEGTFFASRGNMRGDFLIPNNDGGESQLSSMIIGGDAMYVWSIIDGSAYGFKTSLSEPSKIDTKEPVPIDAQVKYTCTDWKVVDGSVFVPPATVSFKDVSTVINEGMEDGTILP